MGGVDGTYGRPKATNCGTELHAVGIEEWDADRDLTRQTDGPAIGGGGERRGEGGVVEVEDGERREGEGVREREREKKEDEWTIANAVRIRR